MADEGKNALQTALVAIGGTGVITTIAVAIRGYFSGSNAQEKGIRDALALENQRLIGDNQRLNKEKTDAEIKADGTRKQLEQAWDDCDVARKDIQVVERQSQHRYRSREEARTRVNLLEQQLNLPQTQWPPDPVETISHD